MFLYILAIIYIHIFTTSFNWALRIQRLSFGVKIIASSDANTVRACDEGNRLTADDYVGGMVASASMPPYGSLVRGIGRVVQGIGEGVSKIVQHTGDTVSVLELLEEEEKGKEIGQEIDQMLAFVLFCCMILENLLYDQNEIIMFCI